MGNNTGEEAPFPLTDVDKWILSQTDEEFQYHDWDELREILGKIDVSTSCCSVIPNQPGQKQTTSPF